MKHPLSGMCIAFCLGITAAAYLAIPFFVFYLCSLSCLIFSIVFLKRNLKFTIFILCACFFLGASLFSNSRILPEHHIAKIVPYKSDAVSIVGAVESDPVHQDAKTSFILKVEKLKINQTWLKVCGRALVRIFKKRDFAYGDRLFLEGKLYRPFNFSREFNYRGYLRNKGIYLIFSVRKDSLIKRLDENISNPIRIFAFKIKKKMRRVIVSNLSTFSAGVLNAVILGERQNLPDYVRDVFARTGTAHIIAISGLHLGIAAFIILVILKIIRVPRRPRYLLAILLLVFYCLLTGANPPAVRATVMAAILLFGCFLERQANIYNSLALAALIILSVNPGALFEVSFQLSFVSVVSIVWLSPKIKSIFPEELGKVRRLNLLISVFSVALAAWLGLLPLIAYYFKIFSPVTILANMIVAPYMTIIVAAGFSLGLIGIFFPLASIFACANELFILALFKIVTFLVALPGAYFKLSGVSLFGVLSYYAILVIIVYFFHRQGKSRQQTPC